MKAIMVNATSNGKVKLTNAKKRGTGRWGLRGRCLCHKSRHLILLKHEFDPRSAHKDGRTDLHTWAVSHVPAHTSCTHIHTIVI